MITMLSMGRHKPPEVIEPIPVYNIVYTPKRASRGTATRYDELVPSYDIERTDPAEADMVSKVVGSKPTHEQAEALVELLLAEDAQQRANDALNTNTMENKYEH